MRKRIDGKEELKRLRHNVINKESRLVSVVKGENLCFTKCLFYLEGNFANVYKNGNYSFNGTFKIEFHGTYRFKISIFEINYHKVKQIHIYEKPDGSKYLNIYMEY